MFFTVQQFRGGGGGVYVNRRPRLPAEQCFTMEFCLCGAILNLTAFCSIWTLIEECSSIK